MPSGKGENKFAFGGEVQEKHFAQQVTTNKLFVGCATCSYYLVTIKGRSHCNGGGSMLEKVTILSWPKQTGVNFPNLIHNCYGRCAVQFPASDDLKKSNTHTLEGGGLLALGVAGHDEQLHDHRLPRWTVWKIQHRKHPGNKREHGPGNQ